MILRHPGISPTNDLVAKKIFSNPEITCQFIRDMLDLPAKNVTILEGSNIHVLPSLPYSAQDFYTSIDVLAELDNGTQVIIEIQVHHQNFFINRLWAYLCSQVNQNLEKIRQREGDTHQSYKHIAPVYAIAIVDSNYFQDDLAFHSFSMREDTTGEVLTITNNGQENHLVKMAFLELRKYRETSKDEVRKPWLEFFGNKPFTQQPERAISQADQLLDYKSWSEEDRECLVNYVCAKNKRYWHRIMPWRLLGRKVLNRDWNVVLSVGKLKEGKKGNFLHFWIWYANMF